jgi:hypothetical protein
MAELLFTYLTEVLEKNTHIVAKAMVEDLLQIKGRALPPYLKPYAQKFKPNQKRGEGTFNKRQHAS